MAAFKISVGRGVVEQFGMRLSRIGAFVVAFCSQFIPSLLYPLSGPVSFPFLGSLKFLKAGIIGGVASALIDENELHGPIFQIKTGPINQIWCSDMEMVTKIFKMENCCGRSSLKEPVFGGDFLFLVRDADRAKDIKNHQKAIMNNLSEKKRISEAVASVGLAGIIEAAGESERGGLIRLSWPQQAIAEATFDALMTVYIGSQPLSREEVGKLLNAVALYRKRGLGLVQSIQNTLLMLLGRDKKLGPAQQIKSILQLAIERSGASEDLLPLLVSATVGGSEIFPLLLQWIVLRLSVDPTTQDLLCASILDEERTPRTPPALFGACISRCAYDCPVSAAIGPPRKVTSEATFEGWTLPAESIVFAMHPNLPHSPKSLPNALVGGSAVSPGPVTWPLEVSRGARQGGAGESDGRNSHGTSFNFPMFGIGPRACPAADQSIIFLSALLLQLVRTWKWAPSNGADGATMFTYKEDGSLFIPSVNTPLHFHRR